MYFVFVRFGAIAQKNPLRVRRGGKYFELGGLVKRGPLTVELVKIERSYDLPFAPCLATSLEVHSNHRIPGTLSTADCA